MSATRGKPDQEELQARARDVRLLVLDVDGVLTDGGLYYGAQGEALKRFDVKDGHALVMARLVGLPSAIITARESAIVECRAAELKIAAVMQGRRYKLPALKELLVQMNVPAEACAYMGDDVNDLPPMGHVGLPACPADGALETRQRAVFISQFPGGRGAVRELVELCLKASGRWEQALALMQPAETGD